MGLLDLEFQGMLGPAPTGLRAARLESLLRLYCFCRFRGPFEQCRSRGGVGWGGGTRQPVALLSAVTAGAAGG